MQQRLHKQRRSIALLLGIAGCATTLALIGCGSSGGAGGGNGDSTLGVYVTDSFNDDYSQVWATLYKIEASTNGTSYVTLYEDSAGKTLNLSALANTAEFLGSLKIPAGNYTQVRVTFGDHLTLVAKIGGTSQSVAVADSVGVHNGGKVALTVATNTSTSPGHASNLVVDFDLAAFQLVGGKLLPHLQDGDDTTIQQKAKHASLPGTVSNLTSTDSQTNAATFDLIKQGEPVSVIVTGTTVIMASNNQTTLSLANGQKVLVQGTIDPTTHALTADQIEIQVGSPGGGGGGNALPAHAAGAVTNVDTIENLFVVTLRQADRFQPTGGAITVVTNGQTLIYLSKRGGPATFADIVSGTNLHVAGSFDAATQTLTADRIEIEH